MTFGENLTKFRKARGLTQASLAEQLGVAKSTIAGYEGNHREPNIPTIFEITKILEITGNDLLGIETSHSNIATKNEQSLLDRFNKLNDNGKQKASDYVEDLAGNRKYLKNTYTEERVELSKELA